MFLTLFKQFAWLEEDDLHFWSTPFTPMKQNTNESIETEAGGSGLALGQEQVPPEVINTKHEILKCDTKLS